MKKFLVSILVLSSILLSCSEDKGTNPEGKNFTISKEMPNFLMPLSIGNYWKYKVNSYWEEFGKSTKNDSNYVKYSLNKKENILWDRFGIRETFLMDSDSIDSEIFGKKNYYSKPFCYNTAFTKIQDTLFVGNYSNDTSNYFDKFLYLPDSYTFAHDGWEVLDLRFNKKIGKYQFDTVYCLQKIYTAGNDKYALEVSFVRGVGMVAYDEYYNNGKFFNLRMTLEDYNVR